MIIGLQYLRAIAVLLVVITHSYNFIYARMDFSVHQQSEIFDLIKSYIHLGDLGVDIFFVLSGFIMVLVTHSDSSTFDFFKKRFVRIVPLYWFYSFIVLFSFLLLNPTSIVWNDVVGSFFFIPILTSQGYLGFLGPGWTLSYEMFFYLMFGFLFFLRELLTRIVALFFIFIFLLWMSSIFPNKYMLFWGNTIILEFLMGMIVAYLYKKGIVCFEINLTLALFFVILVLFFLVFFVTDHSQLDYFRFIYYGFPSVLFLFLFLAVNTSSRLLHRIGDMSYTIYLAHLAFIFQLFGKVVPIDEFVNGVYSFFIIWFLLLLFTVYVSNFLYIYVELFLINYFKGKFF